MDNTNRIINNKKYRDYLNKLDCIEKDREFCKHNLEHFLDVARIAYIQVLEKKLNYSQDMIYTIALLHDIGRVLEYEDGTPHHEASMLLSEEILDDTSYTELEKQQIMRAIGNHRSDVKEELSKLIYRSDKLSRVCFTCKAYDKCYWKKERKNYLIVW